MCENTVSKEPFILKHCPNKLNSQEMCKESVNTCLPLLTFVPNWFATDKIKILITNKMLKDFGNAVFFNDKSLLMQVLMSHFLVMIWLLIM